MAPDTGGSICVLFCGSLRVDMSIPRTLCVCVTHYWLLFVCTGICAIPCLAGLGMYYIVLHTVCMASIVLDGSLPGPDCALAVPVGQRLVAAASGLVCRVNTMLQHRSCCTRTVSQSEVTLQSPSQHVHVATMVKTPYLALPVTESKHMRQPQFEHTINM